MREEDFWSYIQAAKDAAGASVEARTKGLTGELSRLDLDGIEAFQRRYDELIKRSNRWDLWGAAYVMNGGCSDDCFRYFRDWLVSEGRDTFERALANPDSLSEFAPREFFELESFGYVARKVYRTKSGGQEPAIDYSGELSRPAGKEWAEADLPRMFPKLAAKYLRH